MRRERKLHSHSFPRVDSFVIVIHDYALSRPVGCDFERGYFGETAKELLVHLSGVGDVQFVDLCLCVFSRGYPFFVVFKGTQKEKANFNWPRSCLKLRANVNTLAYPLNRIKGLFATPA